jgi:hypothetical protein
MWWIKGLRGKIQNAKRSVYGEEELVTVKYPETKLSDTINFKKNGDFWQRNIYDKDCQL